MVNKYRQGLQSARSKPPLYPVECQLNMVPPTKSFEKIQPPGSYMRCDAYNDIDVVPTSCRAPEFLSFFNTSKPNKMTTFVEWKTAPKKRKKKKVFDALDETFSLPLPQHEESSVDSRSAASEQQYRSKENNPPTPVRTLNSNPGTSNLPFRQRSSFYSENQELVEQVSTKAGVHDNLLKMRREMAELRRWAQERKDKVRRKKVQFAKTLISSVEYRPRTRPEDVDELYFNEDDLLDWEEDRETTSPEHFECMITEGRPESLHVAFDYRLSFE